MFGVKLTRNSIREAVNKTKDVIGNTYRTTKQIFGDVDTGIRAAKTIYSVAAPLISDLLGINYEQTNKHVMNALSGYENIRTKVMQTDEELQNNYNAILGGLQKQKIKFEL